MKLDRTIDVIVAGHVCLDIIPRLHASQRSADDLFVPGSLFHTGPATLALGGSVANTGITLHRLGATTRLVGKLGDDHFGNVALALLRDVDPSIVEHMIVAIGEPTSYSIVFSPPDVDRGFLHCPGTNDTFVSSDLAHVPHESTHILHFGYPPLMAGTYADGGRGLAEEFAKAQAAGALVSLDMAAPQPDATNWRAWLRNVLPHVDVFLPSLDEISLMLDPLHECRDADTVQTLRDASAVDPSTLREVADELHGLGVPIVVIKLGDQGLYIRTSKNVLKLKERAAWQGFDWNRWVDRDLLSPCFDVEVVGTTGSGDCTIAGFLAALLRGLGPEAAVRFATAVGAFSVQSADATSNIPDHAQVNTFLEATRPHRPLSAPWPDWRFSPEHGIYVGPTDVKQSSTPAAT